MAVLQQVFPLVQVSGVKQKLGMHHAKILAFLVNAALAQHHNLVAVGQGLHSDRPLFQGQLASFGSSHSVNLHKVLPG